MITRQQGISLIELIIFIIVLGILGTGILSAFIVSLEKTPDINKISRATEIAQARMEVVLGQLSQNFNINTDPCEEEPLPIELENICEIPDGYEIASSSIEIDENDANLKHITITVSSDSKTLASLYTTVTNY